MVVLGEVLCVFDDLYGFLLSVLDGNVWHLERSKTNESGATLDEEWRWRMLDKARRYVMMTLWARIAALMWRRPID